MSKLKAISHVHSDWSYDGRWTLHELADYFSRFKVRVLLMTEHERGFDQGRWEEYKKACHAASGDDLLIIPGVEYNDASNTTHVLVWGNAPFLGTELPTEELLRKAKEYNCITVLAHPKGRDAYKSFDGQWCQYLNGIELWNRKTDGFSLSTIARNMLHQNESICAFAGLDFHGPKQIFPLSMRLLVNEVSESGVLEAIENRKCYPRAYGLPLLFWNNAVGLAIMTIMEKGRKALLWCIRRGK